ncbi:MAG: YdiU family protein [Bacillota bacterium]|nr:YdiU family protein [Bacillota bacterium]
MDTKTARTKIGWNFDNGYARLPESFYTLMGPAPVRSPELAVLNHDLACLLGLDPKELSGREGVAIFAGNMIPEGAQPLAQAYAGHQFGYFTMLGDGRAILLGEQIAPSGMRYDIQLKGSGRTPYSRGGDGRAVLGPMLREYIISEAMHALGIPTTRSLAVVTTGESVYRKTALPGAVLTRVAESHIRVGTFEYAARWWDPDELKALADHTLERHFSHTGGPDSPEPDSGKSKSCVGSDGDDVRDDAADIGNQYLRLLKEVVRRQAELIAKWQLVGFIHGVMNTDNMALSGETIDYGPCAFMDTYDPDTVFSSIDIYGRYAYGNQPGIAGWNLARFAETLLPLLHEDENRAVELAQNAVSEFDRLFHGAWLKGMRSKLGLFDEEPQDEGLVKSLLEIMHRNKADFTNTFRALTYDEDLDIDMFSTDEFRQWKASWHERLGRQQQTKSSVFRLMKENNPVVIPRNHRVEEALEAAEKHGDYSVMERLVCVLSRPYEYTSEKDHYSSPPEPSSCRYQTFCGT